MTEKVEKSKGFVIVATRKPNFYKYAVNLANSILDYYEDARITLFCEPWMLEEQDKELFEHIFTDVPSHYRGKCYGIAKSPYDITCYLDADMECEHEDIAKVFDELKGADIMFSELTDERSYVYAERDFDTPEGKEKFTLCGGIALYDMTKPIVREFLWDWWELTRKQMDHEWWPQGYAESLRSWDQFSLWWLTNKEPKYKDLDLRIIDDDLRWNYYNALNWARGPWPKGPIVVRHYSCGLDKDGRIV
jgi:hypothetical protein